MKIYFTWMKKYVFDKNVSYWIQINFNWIKTYFDAMKKRWYNENVNIKYKVLC